MNNSIYNQLTANLELLKLSQMKLHLDEIRDFVTNNGLSFTEGLLKLSNYEVDFKEQSASRSMIKAAAFPFVKELKDFDFEFQPSVNEQEMRELTNLGFLEKNENIVFLGPSGVGKTHLATSIGIAAAKKRVSTYFKLATPISNGGLLFHPPGAITVSAQGGISQHHFYLLPPKESSYLLPSSNLSFSSCS